MTPSLDSSSVSGWEWLPVAFGFGLDASLTWVDARTLR